MGHWIVTAIALVTVLVLSGVYMAFFWPGLVTRKSASMKRDMRATWKVVLLGGPLPEAVGLPKDVKYGVIVSTDEMLERTQTILFCPLISGVDEDENPLAILPWHVPVQIRPEPDKHIAEINYARKFVSTKIVLPIAFNEIDMDGRERGYLDEHSRAAVATKLAAWLPAFSRIAHR